MGEFFTSVRPTRSFAEDTLHDIHVYKSPRQSLTRTFLLFMSSTCYVDSPVIPEAKWKISNISFVREFVMRLLSRIPTGQWYQKPDFDSFFGCKAKFSKRHILLKNMKEMLTFSREHHVQGLKQHFFQNTYQKVEVKIAIFG